MPTVAAVAVVIAFVLDLTIEEFPQRLHPVAWYGGLLESLDRDWPWSRLISVMIALGAPLAVAGMAGGVVALGLRIGPWVGAIVAGLVLFSTVSLRMLLRVSRSVIDASDTDLSTAREELLALAGREASSLSPPQVRSAAVESTAENVADGLVAPLIAFAIGSIISLPVGAAGALWVKAVNTGDSMLGYPSNPSGWASARLDDAVMWLPARLAALLLALVGLKPGALWRARRWAQRPPSPNSGWPMATLAVILGVRLEKPGEYELGPEGALPTVEQAHRGVRLTGFAGLLAFLGAGVIAWP